MKKSVLAIHDLSCHAASSLSVVLPLLLSAGLDTSFLPSALLSSQSDGFDNLFVRDLSRECDEIMDRWKSYSLHFDCLYTGYLASESQLELVLRARSAFLSPSSLIVTDPVMGDEGKLYQNLGSSHIAMMKSLCRGSSVITPNYTEALLLAGRSDGYTAESCHLNALPLWSSRAFLYQEAFMRIWHVTALRCVLSHMRTCMQAIPAAEICSHRFLWLFFSTMRASSSRCTKQVRLQAMR